MISMYQGKALLCKAGYIAYGEEVSRDHLCQQPIVVKTEDSVWTAGWVGRPGM